MDKPNFIFLVDLESEKTALQNCIIKNDLQLKMLVKITCFNIK